jgi:fructan beta-fructosidase
MSRPPLSDRTSDDRYRPRFHFTPERNWMNDPNGLIHFDERWHLYYQHNPHGDRWGSMHWGHAESEDLIRWRHLPVALFPDRLGTVFSGSVVADRRNTSGLFPTDGGGLAAVYTHFKWGLQRQGMATSTDGGLSWKPYGGNPVIKNPFLIHFRDPKVFYHGQTGQWVMLLTIGNRIRFYRSKDLREWETTGEFGNGAGAHGGVWECPDLFELAVDGDADDRGNRKWVLVVSVKKGAPGGGSGTQYFIGRFDGSRFIADEPAGAVRWLDYGADNYAGITFNDVPEADGRRIFIGWMSNWDYALRTPTAPWRGAMTVPRELKLVGGEDGPVLAAAPVDELRQYRTEAVSLGGRVVEGGLNVREGTLRDGVYEIDARWGAGAKAPFGIVLKNEREERVALEFDPAAERLTLDRSRSGDITFSGRFSGFHSAPLKSRGRGVELRILVDRCSVEVFADGGRAVITDLVFPSAPYGRVELFSEAAVRLSSFSLWGLNTGQEAHGR